MKFKANKTKHPRLPSEWVECRATMPERGKPWVIVLTLHGKEEVFSTSRVEEMRLYPDLSYYITPKSGSVYQIKDY